MVPDDTILLCGEGVHTFSTQDRDEFKARNIGLRDGEIAFIYQA
jgi:hypothetical protein